MITRKDTPIVAFIDHLNTQKSLYEQILILSDRESGIIKSKPFSMARVLEVLQTKNTLVTRIQVIEQQLAEQRCQIDFNDISVSLKEEISGLIQYIGSLLRKLLAQDSANEEMLRECVCSGNKPTVNTHYAMKAYGAYAK